MARAPFEKRGERIRWFLILVAILSFAIAAFVAAVRSEALWDAGLRLQLRRSVYVEAGLERLLLAERIGSGQYWGGGFEWEVAAPVSVSIGVRYFRGDYRDWPTDRVGAELGVVLYFD